VRLIVLVIASLALGAALGAGMAVLRARSALRPIDAEAAPPPPAPADEPPKAVVDKAEFDFGVMDASEERRHDFVISNQGSGPLRLVAGGTSCRCTVSQLEKEQIPPGAATKVTLTWKTRNVLGPYRQTANILTNDPARPEITLTVSGEVVTAVRAEPADLVFTRLPAGEAASGEVRLWCNLPDHPLQILDFKLSDKGTAGHFKVTHQPLGQEAVRREKDAKSGVLVRVAITPGLPQGRFHQNIELRTNVPATPTLTIPVHGDIASDISVAGAGWNPDTGTLFLGPVNRRDGARRRLLLIVRGPQGKEVKFKLARVQPAFLVVKLGPTTAVGQGGLVQTPLEIEVPKGSPLANHLGSEQGELGQIMLETTHPQARQLRIFVQFAVEG
jgi:hypothetical protein